METISNLVSCKASQTSQKAGRVRAAQKVPIHMRRRAASHNVKRLPRHLRQKALTEASSWIQNIFFLLPVFVLRSHYKILSSH